MIKTSIGIQITGNDLRIALLKSTFGKVRLVRTSLIPEFFQMPLEKQKKEVMDLVRKTRLSASRVFLSLPHHRGMVRQIEFPVEVKETLKAALELQIETLSPWPANEIYWDYSFEAPKKQEKQLRVTVVIVPRLELDPWIEFFKAVRLPLSGASLSTVSSAHAIGALWAGGGPMLVLESDGSAVEGMLVKQGRLGAIRLTGNDLAQLLKSVSEKLLSPGRVSAAELQRVLTYGSKTEEFQRENPDLPIENSKRESAHAFGSIAAALLGIKSTAFSANLVPKQLRHRRNQLHLIPTYVLVGMTVLLGLAVLVREPYQMSMYGSQLESEIKRLAPAVKDVAQQEAELDALTNRYRALAGHFQQRDLNLESMRELTRVLPSTAFLINYTYQDGALTLAGFAASASEVQKVLEDSLLFKDVQFTSSVTKDAGGKDRFTLRASIEVQR